MGREVMGLLSRSIGALHWQFSRRVRGHLPVILMYHRVAEVACDPWRLCVSPANFEAQIKALMQQREVVPLEQIFTHRSDRPLAAVTFDDGYRDVVTNALPILQAHGCPATLFLATDWVGSAREFWWDELARLVLETRLGAAVDIAAPGSDQTCRLEPRDSGRARRRLLQEIWDALLPLNHAEKQVWIANLAGQCSVSLTMRDSHRIVDAADVAGLRGSMLSIGAHTGTHLSLPLFGAAEQVDEITRSRKVCADLTGEVPPCFAYPFGHHDIAIADRVREAGFSAAVTTFRGMVRERRDPMRLPRLTVEDWSGRTFLRKLPS